LHEESDGTQRLFELLGPWQNVLEQGYTLVVDELNASMHTLMVRKLVESFQHPEINKSGAQLIFTTHDTNLLDPSLLRRDQIWFTEKDGEGASHLYSLQDYHPRKGEALEKGYLLGRYGSIPFLGEMAFR
jgi:AAA15 family ATPase/GTPase